MDIQIKDVAEAVKGIVEVVPIYDDLIQPAAKELGKSLETVAKVINVALSPVSALVWGYDQIKAYIQPALEQRLKDIPQERIIPPDPAIAGPALDALRYTGHKEDLRELYANLIATAMDSNTTHTAHPAFVEVIRQLTPDEAKIITFLSIDDAYVPLVNLRQIVNDGQVTIYRNFSLVGEQAGCLNVNLTPSYLDNLVRLGLIEIPAQASLTTTSLYDNLENHPIMRKIKDLSEASTLFTRGYFHLTAFGKQFCDTCI